MVKIPLFLAPAFTEVASRTVCRSVVRSFSSTPCNEARSRTKRSGGRDSNKQRGVSVMRSTGTRHTLSVEKIYPELPRPRLPSVRREILQHEQYKTDPDHGLYGFFNQARETVRPGLDESAFGRAWEQGDLTFKSFEDLHSLWWKCHLELNRISTRSSEHSRLRLGYGKNELNDRKRAVAQSLRAIRKTLIHREQAYQHAKALLENEGILSLDQKLKEEEEQANISSDLQDHSHASSGPKLPMPKV